MAGGTRLSADEGRVGIGPLRGAVLAGLPSSRLPGDAGLWVLDLGTAASEETPGEAGKKRGTEPVITLPAVRRALQQMLSPRARPECPHCNPAHPQYTGRSAILKE